MGEKSGKVASTIRVVPSGTTHSIFNHEDTERFARGVKYYEFMDVPQLPNLVLLAIRLSFLTDQFLFKSPERLKSLKTGQVLDFLRNLDCMNSIFIATKTTTGLAEQSYQNRLWI